jgi:Flp pilus assembly protein TadG
MLPYVTSIARSSRRGSVSVVVALTLPIVLGVAALGLDAGLLYLQRRQAQSAADAGALAGAYALSNGSSFSTAQSAAISVGSQNGITITASQVTEPAQYVAGSAIAVTVTSTKRRSFSAIWGAGTMTATAIAMAFAQTSINGFQGSGSLNASLLPIALDKADWTNMMTGQSTDQYTYNAASNTVSNGPDGIYEAQMYPLSGLPGNDGTIKVGVNDNSTSTLSAQISGGITAYQLSQYPNSTIQLDSTLSPPSITFQGNPGLSAAIGSALTAIIGQPVAVPIYDQSAENGNNATYRVIAFQPARILAVSLTGNSKYVVIQPAILNDPTGIPGTPQAWSSGGLRSLQLTQ